VRLINGAATWLDASGGGGVAAAVAARVFETVNVDPQRTAERLLCTLRCCTLAWQGNRIIVIGGGGGQWRGRRPVERQCEGGCATAKLDLQ
jgi:hypothetical protein